MSFTIASHFSFDDSCATTLFTFWHKAPVICPKSAPISNMLLFSLNGYQLIIFSLMSDKESTTSNLSSFL